MCVCVCVCVCVCPGCGGVQNTCKGRGECPLMGVISRNPTSQCDRSGGQTYIRKL